MEIVIVAALDEGSVIGRDDGMPWHLPADLKFFMSKTMGKPMVMGRRTHETLDQPLRGRINIVMSRGGEVPEGWVLAGSLEEALELGRQADAQELMVMGGAQIYELFLPITDRMILTVVHDRYEGDTFFPWFESEDWELVNAAGRAADAENASAMTFVDLKAATAGPRRVRRREEPGDLPEILRF